MNLVLRNVTNLIFFYDVEVHESGREFLHSFWSGRSLKGDEFKKFIVDIFLSCHGQVWLYSRFQIPFQTLHTIIHYPELPLHLLIDLGQVVSF
jgi:hypothetical protein